MINSILHIYVLIGDTKETKNCTELSVTLNLGCSSYVYVFNAYTVGAKKSRSKSVRLTLAAPLLLLPFLLQCMS